MRVQAKHNQLKEKRTSLAPANEGARLAAAVDSLRRADPYALRALVEHARDAGYPLSGPMLRTLHAAGLSDGKHVVPEVRAWVAQHVSGAGVATELAPAARALLAHSAGAPLAPSGVGLGTARVRFGLDAPLAVEIARLRGTGDHKKAAALLEGVARAMATSKRAPSVTDMVRFSAAAATLVDAHGRALPALQALLYGTEQVLAGKLSPRVALVFQDLAASVGAKLAQPSQMPMRRAPYWQKETHALLGFQSTKQLPEEADIVIVGAGMTGGSAALHLAEEAKQKGLKVVLLDAGEVASQASGRNGGNLEAIPENFFGAYGTYDGYAEERYKFLKHSYPHLPERVLRAQAQRIAETIIKFGYKNAKLVVDDVTKHGLQVDHSLAGWLRLALNEREETALKKEVQLGEKLGLGIKLISPADVKKRYRIDTKFHGRVVENNGNFHPFKLVVQAVQRAVLQGVQLHTNTPVSKIESKSADEHIVKTARGDIRAKKVIVATNAFTSELFPQLSDIQYFRSQIVNFAHMRNDLNGITFTAKDGDIYGNFPKQDWYTDDAGQKRGTLHLGGGQDTKAKGPANARPSAKVFRLIQHEAKEIFPDLEGRVPLRTWAGPMAFVEGKHGMRMPVISPLGAGAQQGVLVAVWCNGYGSTGCHKAGAEAARWALTGALSDDVPQDVFGVARLMSDEPMFDATRGGPREP